MLTRSPDVTAPRAVRPELAALDLAQVRDALRRMHLIRKFEETAEQSYMRGLVHGTMHLSIGQEASAVGAVLPLRPDDYILSTHRGHGHCIAKGVDVHGMMAEIYGKKTGVCRGKGGSMHIADLSMGMLGANGIVGAGGPLVCGAALAAKHKKTGGVGVCFFGDGASNQGVIFESMNLASVWRLPAIFVAENNGYAEATSSSWSVATDNIADRANGFGMPGVIVDGFDFFAVHEALGEAVARARNGGGPTLVEVKFTRYFGHFEGDAQTYRAPGEVQKLRDEKDCLKHFETRVVRAEVLTTDELRAVDAQVKALIDDAVAQAKAAPLPDAADLLTDVYVSYP